MRFDWLGRETGAKLEEVGWAMLRSLEDCVYASPFRAMYNSRENNRKLYLLDLKRRRKDTLTLGSKDGTAYIQGMREGEEEG